MSTTSNTISTPVDPDPKTEPSPAWLAMMNAPRATAVAGSSWASAIEAWSLAQLDAGKSPATVGGYAKHLGWLAGDLSDAYPDPWELLPAAVTRWLDEQGWSAQTRRKVLVSLRAFYTWGMLDGSCRRSPMAGVASVPPRKRGQERLAVPLLWQEPLAEYLVALRASGRQPGTVAQRRHWITRLAETYADPWTITTADLALFMSRDDWAPETKRGAANSARSFYRWAETSGYVARNPAERLDAVRVRRSVPRPAPDDAVRIALRVADARTRLAILIGVYAGLRRTEIARIHSRDIRDDTLLVHGKGGHERLIPLHPELARELTEEMARRRAGRPMVAGWGQTVPDANGWLFPGNDDGHLSPWWVGKLMSRALPDGWTAHTLRHRFGTQAYKVGRDLRAVQELLGHTKPETTARYAAVPTGALLAAVSGVGPEGS